MKKIKYFILPILLFLGSLSHVSASAVSYKAVGYGYTQTINGVTSSTVWETYSPNNLVKYNYDIPNYPTATIIDISEFDFRFDIGSNFLQGNTYTLTFDWTNYSENNDYFLSYFQAMNSTLSCRVGNWSATNEVASSCFNSFNISATSSTSDTIIVNLTFTPKKDFFGLTMQNKLNNSTYYSSYESEGWEVNNFDYSFSTDGTQNIINNQNQNTQNIINNQNQNAQDIQDTLNDNLRSCRDSYNLFNATTGTTTRAGVTFTKNSDGSYTANGTATNNIFFQIGTYTFVSGTSLYLSGSTGGSNSTYFLQINASPYTTNTNGYSAVGSTASGSKPIIIYVANGTQMNNVVFKPMLSIDRIPYEKYGEQFCQSKLDDTNSAINDVNSSINNSDVSGANSDAASFFNNFSTSNNGGISGIITAPLIAINRMLDNQCSPLSFTYRGQTVSFPCGTDTWNQLSDIRNFLNLTEGGALCYLILRKLFLLIDNLKNPDSDKVEVMSL